MAQAQRQHQAETLYMERRFDAAPERVFDALTHVRPYKDAWTDERAFEEMVNQRGRHFAPEPFDAFLRHMKAVGRYA